MLARTNRGFPHNPVRASTHPTDLDSEGGQSPNFSSPLTHVGAADGRLFAAAPWLDGRIAAEWMVHHGRFPPEVVLEIARAMVIGLIELEQRGICHGDVSLASLLLTDTGRVALLLPGLRGVLRPEEGYAHADLLPEAFDGMSPERITAGTPPSTASDVYACGCVWWQMLCGRPPLAGGDSLAKLRAAQAGDIGDVRRWAADVPAALAAAIAACTEREPSHRPDTMARVGAMLGPPTRSGKEALVDCLARTGRPAVRWTTTVRRVRRSSRTPLWSAAAVCLLAAAVAVLGPVWHGRSWPLAHDSRQPAVARKAEDRHPTADVSAVVSAAYQQPIGPPEDMVLSDGGRVSSASLSLRAGQCVRASKGRRATVLVPAEGLVVDKEDVRFDGVDFVWDRRLGRARRAGPCGNRMVAGQPGELSRLHVPSGGGRRRGRRTSVAAIQWEHPGLADAEETSLPNGRIELVDCLMQQVDVGVDCHTIGAIDLEFNNTLHLGPGPMVRLDHCPQADEPLVLSLEQVTLRGGGPLLECHMPRRENQPGEMTIRATACVFRRGRASRWCGWTARLQRTACSNAYVGPGRARWLRPSVPILVRADRWPRSVRGRVVVVDRRVGAQRGEFRRSAVERSRRQPHPPLAGAVTIGQSTGHWIEFDGQARSLTIRPIGHDGFVPSVARRHKRRKVTGVDPYSGGSGGIANMRGI